MWWPTTRAQQWLTGAVCVLLLLATIWAIRFSQSEMTKRENALRAVTASAPAERPRRKGRGSAKAISIHKRTSSTESHTTPVISSDPRIAALRDKFARSEQYADRETVARELADIGTRDSCESLVGMMEREEEVAVRVAIWEMLTSFASAGFTTAPVESAILREYDSVVEVDEQQAMLRTAARCATSSCTVLLRTVAADTDADPDERATAMACIGHLVARSLMEMQPTERESLAASLRQEAQAALHTDTRIECLRSLSALSANAGKSQIAGMMEHERDPAVLRVLEELGR